MEVMDMNVDYDLSRICRSCRKDCPVLHPIFDSIGSSGATLYEMMSVCTQLQIHYNDGMPRNLCSPCVTDINTAYSFRKRCEQSDMMLREYILRRRQGGGSGADGGSAVKLELFEIKPEITYIEADPLIGEKCFAMSIRSGREGEEVIEGDNPEEGLIEALDDEDDGEVFGGDDLIEAEFVDDSDKDSNVEYDAGNLDDIIEEVDTEAEDEKPLARLVRGKKGHGYTKIKGGQFACDSCERVFTDKRGITNHVKQHEPKTMKECPTCGRKFTTNYHLSRHMKTHDEEVQCEHCERKFSAAVYDEYRQHMEEDHPGKELLPQRKIEDKEEQDSDKRFRCKICHIGFNRSTHLTRHMNGHGSVKRFECDFCQKKFHRKDNLTTHLKRHGKTRSKVEVPSPTQQNAEVDKSIEEDTKEGILKEKPKPQPKLCSICGQSFGRTYHLNRHMRMHAAKPDFPMKPKKMTVPGLKIRRPTGSIKSLQCAICEKWFGRSYHLKRHMMKVHGAAGVKPDPEDQKVKFEKSEQDLALALTADIVEELGKMEAICRICDSSFERIAELRRHLRTHEDPETFSDVNIHTKPYLFEEGYVLENYAEYLVQQVCKWDVLRFYQIVEPDGEELELSDSDSEPEDPDQPPVEGIVRREHFCALCSQSFPRIKTIMEHAREQHRPEDLIGCRHCSRGFPSTELLVRHLKQQCENHHKKFFCTFCNEKFMWQTSLNKHAQYKHKPTKPLWDRADLSGATAGEGDDKEKKFMCQVCCKGFQRLEHLERHIKIHIPSEKKFECTLCHKKFNRKDNLRSHMKIHTKEPEEDPAIKQTHLCVYCGRGFSNSSNLIVHMRRHTGERPYKCDICDKGFPRSSDLQCHRRTHTGEKPCLCTICGKGFSRSNKLVRHMRIHTGARPYACTYCDRSFTQSNDLTLHIRRHTGEKPYVCGTCNERFIQGTALKAHQRVTGHCDDGSSQPERFASISVNNPNRLGINGPKAVRQNPGTASDDLLPKMVKPVKSRKKANQATAGGKSSTSVAPPPASESPATVASSPSVTILPASSVCSAPPSPGESSSGSIRGTSGLHGLSGTPHGYVPMPYLMPNYDLASTGLFSQNFSQQQ